MAKKLTLAKLKLAKKIKKVSKLPAVAPRKRGRPKGKVAMKRSGSSLQFIRKGNQILPCSKCFDDVSCSYDAASVICDRCVAGMVAPPAAAKTKAAKVLGPNGAARKRGRPRIHPVKVPSGFPRGWHFKKRYVHTDGSVWARGKRVETKAVKQLKKAAAGIKEL